MEAGLKLDAAVEELVMGRRVDPSDCGCVDCITGRSVRLPSVPHYSTLIAAAWDVVEEMKRQKYCLLLTHSGDADFVHAMFYRTKPYGAGRAMDKGSSEGDFASTVPLAICRAAIAAMESGT